MSRSLFLSRLNLTRCHALTNPDKSRIRVPLLDAAPVGSSETDRIALTYWTRSAAQDNVDALVKLGDYYFKGIGTSARPNLDGAEDKADDKTSNARVPQYEKAATFYQSAATSRLSAMAMWNLGWMHETGHGVPQVSCAPLFSSKSCGADFLGSRIFTSRNAISMRRSRRLRTRTFLRRCPSSRSMHARSTTSCFRHPTR